MMRPILELIELTKDFRSNWTFRPIRAVDRLSISVAPGEVFGLIGHNGSGKTTTFKLLVGLLRATRGTILWQGRPARWGEPRESLGFAPEQAYFYDYLTVSETLRFYAQLYGLSSSESRQRIHALAQTLRLDPKLNAPVRTLSKGTLQRLAVAQAIVHRPRLVILDEPMSGLDPVGRKTMADLIRALKAEGTTVLFSSHVLTDAEALCDRVAIIDRGELREVVDLNDETTAPISYTITYSGGSDSILEILARIAVEPPKGGPERWTVKCANRETVRAALAELQRVRADVEAVLPQRPSLEQRFFHLVGDDAHLD